MSDYKLYNGNCLDELKNLDDNSVDSIVTDPPYGLSFMGKKWDYDVPSEEIWRECLRVLKPGGHLLAFAGTRTQHRMAVRIEDAGFEIRDMIAWVYGSGFPKSLNVANSIHDAAIGQPQGGAKPSSKNHGKFKSGCSSENETGRGFGAGPGQFMVEAGGKAERDLVTEAITWQGWGSALKPALEPITVARKPLVGTVAENVLAHGTGALNIDGCRVGTENTRRTSNAGTNGDGWGMGHRAHLNGSDSGRWPANLIHDGSDEVLALFPDTGKSTGGQASLGAFRNGDVYGKGRDERESRDPGYGDSGSAARFFYCAKASKRDRNSGGVNSTHPTVKPTILMQWLCRLVTPPGGIALDPFMGSGSTGKAAMLENFNFIGIELDPDYYQIAEARIKHAKDHPEYYTDKKPKKKETKSETKKQDSGLDSLFEDSE